MKFTSKDNLNSFTAKLKAWIKARKIAASDLDSGNATNGQVLTANGSGGATWEDASGGHLYRHSLFISQYYHRYFATIITNDATAFTLTSLKDYLYDGGYINSIQKFVSASAYYDADNIVVGICVSEDKTNLYVVVQQANDTVSTLNSGASSVTDTVYQIM